MAVRLCRPPAERCLTLSQSEDIHALLVSNWVDGRNAGWDWPGPDGTLDGTVSSNRDIGSPAITHYPAHGHFGEYTLLCFVIIGLLS